MNSRLTGSKTHHSGSNSVGELEKMLLWRTMNNFGFKDGIDLEIDKETDINVTEVAAERIGDKSIGVRLPWEQWEAYVGPCEGTWFHQQ